LWQILILFPAFFTRPVVLIPPVAPFFNRARAFGLRSRRLETESGIGRIAQAHLG
jgi:hypothetical protein